MTRVYVSDTDDLRLRGAFERVDSVVRAGRRPWYVRWWYSAPAFGILGNVALAGLAVVVLAVLGVDFPVWVPAACAAVAATAALGAAHVYRTTLRRNGLVYLVPRSARPNFLQRKGDDLWLLVIGGIFGAVVTVLAGRLAG
ncbi:hypothetical protein [Nocardioides sp. T2.26MG-1]|uniref:hypothetical protein n=1 Tax=Nocardioides sp. T2.26MG-1 TaxID=3041166 RepID=UPI002477378F|nr:hypothetical protein [Nocardioides sp. T2.26MG-1]CAI9407739.1 hypothetical protein HIDPHFAB_04844 [Nocardioides sp. T2.26MG-1]